METMAVVMFAGLAASSAPRRNAPTLDLITGSGVSVAGAEWRGIPRRTRHIERDSAPWAQALV